MQGNEGLRVEVRISPDRSRRFAEDTVYTGEVITYVFSISGVEGFIEERERVVVRTDCGRVVFARPSQVSVLGSDVQIARAAAYAEILRSEMSLATA